jgi:phage shock protein PspC (stress-responsive transcriptional regulator)
MTGVDSWVWRLLFALLALCAGTGVLLYLLMWILIPADPLTPVTTPSPSQAG